jgi:hypothetical protein
MVDRRRASETVSLLSFLRTGELGPLKLGMSMRATSDLLGPPDWWTDRGGEAPVPRLWGYRRFLEIYFEQEPPHLLAAIKVPVLPAAARKHIRFARFRVATDGFNDGMHLSEFLRRDIWDGDDTLIIGKQTGWNPVIDICAKNVRLVWSMSVSGEEILQRESGDGLSKAAYIARREQLSDGFLGIYASASPKLDRVPLDGWEEFTADQYLALMDSVDIGME